MVAGGGGGKRRLNLFPHSKVAHAWVTGFREALGNVSTHFFIPATSHGGRDTNSPCLYRRRRSGKEQIDDKNNR